MRPGPIHGAMGAFGDGAGFCWAPDRGQRRQVGDILAREGMHGLAVSEIGKALIGLGLLVALIGAALLLAGRIGLPLGRLPGDIGYKGKHVSFYFPLGTCILVSVVLSALFYLISRFHR